MKKALSVILSLILALNLAVPAMATENEAPVLPAEETGETLTEQTPEEPGEGAPEDTLQEQTPPLVGDAPQADPGTGLEAPSLSLTDLSITAGKSLITSASVYLYTYILENDVDAPIVAYAASCVMGYTYTWLIEIQHSLDEIMGQLNEIQGQLSDLSDQINQGFTQLQDTVLQAEYTALVRDYISPVEQAIFDSWSGYIFLSHKSSLRAAELVEDTEAADRIRAEGEDLRNQYTNWDAMEARWNTWVSSYGEDGAMEELYAQWIRDTETIDFTGCLDKLSCLMQSSVGEDTLLSVQQKRLENKYPFAHQITPEMEQVFQYVSALQVRLLTLYRDYTDYCNFLDAQGTYETQEEISAAQKRMDDRTIAYKYDATVAVKVLNQAAQTPGIRDLIQPGQIHQTLITQDGQQIPVYQVRANSDDRFYCIAKEALTLSEIVGNTTTSVYSSYYATAEYEDMMQSGDNRFRTVSYHHGGRGLEGLLADCSGDILLWLRGVGGLTELNPEARLVMTPKITSTVDHSGNFSIMHDELYFIDLQDFDKNLEGSEQYVSFQAYDILGSGEYEGAPMKDLRLLRIYCDMRPAEADEGPVKITQLSQLTDEMCLTDGDVLDLTNTYGNAGGKTVFVSGKVKILGGGSGKPIENLTVQAAAGTELTVENLYWSGSGEETGALVSEEAITLILNGENRIAQGGAENAVFADVTVLAGTGDTLRIEAKDGACMAGPAFRAKGVELHTSANGMEAEPETGRLENCTIHSASGKYDVRKLEISGCSWTEHAPYLVTFQTGGILNAGTSDAVQLTLSGVTVEVSGELSSDTTKTAITYGKAVTAAPGELQLKMKGSDDWYGISLTVSTNLSDYAQPDGRYMICDWVDETTQTIANNNTGIKLKVTTADVSGAGTDADISAAMVWKDANGELCRGTYQNLSDRTAGNAFEAGTTDTVYFRQDAMTGGEPVSLSLKTDGALAGADWKVERIVVTVMEAGREAQSVTVYPDQWIITEDYPYDFVINGEGSQQYRLKIKTGDKSLAGTDANLSFQLVGSNGTTNWITANPYISGNAFERNDTDTVLLTFDRSVGRITGLNIRSDLWGAGAGWYCDYVELWEYDAQTQQTRNHAKVTVASWFEDGSEKQSFAGSTVANLQGSNTGKPLQTVLERLMTQYDTLVVCRADTLHGEYRQVAQLPKDDPAVPEQGLTAGERYYFKIYHPLEDGTLCQVFEILCVEGGTGIVDIPQLKMEAAVLTDAAVEKKLTEAVRTKNDTVQDAALYGLTLYIQKDQWVEAAASDFPEEGRIIVSLPVPAGSDPAVDTYYGAQLCGKNSGEIHFLELDTHTDGEGQVWLDFFVTEAAPVLIGWSDAPDSGKPDAPVVKPSVPDTGDGAAWELWLLAFGLSGAGLWLCLEQLRRRASGGR